MLSKTQDTILFAGEIAPSNLHACSRVALTQVQLELSYMATLLLSNYKQVGSGLVEYLLTALKQVSHIILCHDFF